MGNPVIHFEIGSTAAEQAQRFYGELFGWRIAVDDSGYGQVDTGSDAGIGGGIMPAPQGQQRPWLTFYVEVDDLEKYLARAVELGGTRVVGPTAIGEMGSFAMFADPDGNIVGLFTGPQPG